MIISTNSPFSKAANNIILPQYQQNIYYGKNQDTPYNAYERGFQGQSPQFRYDAQLQYNNNNYNKNNYQNNNIQPSRLMLSKRTLDQNNDRNSFVYQQEQNYGYSNDLRTLKHNTEIRSDNQFQRNNNNMQSKHLRKNSNNISFLSNEQREAENQPKPKPYVAILKRENQDDREIAQKEQKQLAYQRALEEQLLYKKKKQELEQRQQELENYVQEQKKIRQEYEIKQDYYREKQNEEKISSIRGQLSMKQQIEKHSKLQEMRKQNVIQSAENVIPRTPPKAQLNSPYLEDNLLPHRQNQLQDGEIINSLIYDGGKGIDLDNMREFYMFQKKMFQKQIDNIKKEVHQVQYTKEHIKSDMLYLNNKTKQQNIVNQNQYEIDAANQQFNYQQSLDKSINRPTNYRQQSVQIYPDINYQPSQYNNQSKYKEKYFKNNNQVMANVSSYIDIQQRNQLKSQDQKPERQQLKSSNTNNNVVDISVNDISEVKDENADNGDSQAVNNQILNDSLKKQNNSAAEDSEGGEGGGEGGGVVDGESGKRITTAQGGSNAQNNSQQEIKSNNRIATGEPPADKVNNNESFSDTNMQLVNEQSENKLKKKGSEKGKIQGILIKRDSQQDLDGSQISRSTSANAAGNQININDPSIDNLLSDINSIMTQLKQNNPEEEARREMKEQMQSSKFNLISISQQKQNNIDLAAAVGSGGNSNIGGGDNGKGGGEQGNNIEAINTEPDLTSDQPEQYQLQQQITPRGPEDVDFEESYQKLENLIKDFQDDQKYKTMSKYKSRVGGAE